MRRSVWHDAGSLLKLGNESPFGLRIDDELSLAFVSDKVGAVRKAALISTTTGPTAGIASGDHSASPIDDDSRRRLDDLKQLIMRLGELLPAQGPITAFVFLNTLQALEDLPFDEGLLKGARLFGCRPFLSEDFYREKLDKGRIQLDDVAAVLKEDLGERAEEPLGELGTVLDLRLAMVRHPIRHGPAEELRWFVAETDALTRLPADVTPADRDRFIEETRHWVMRDMRNGGSNASGHTTRGGPRDVVADLLKRYGEGSIERWTPEMWEAIGLQALWRICRERVHGIEPKAVEIQPLLRHRDVLMDATGEDTDVLVHELMIRYCAAFADQGFAPFSLPDRNAGFFRAFCRLYGDTCSSPQPWLKELPKEIHRVQSSGLSPIELVHESLTLLGVDRREWDDFLAATMLALRGWAGLIHQMEIRGDRVPLPASAGTTIEFLAVRLMLERIALAYTARKTLGFEGPLDELRGAVLAQRNGRPPSSIEERAFLLFQTAEATGWNAAQLYQLTRPEWLRLVVEVESFNSLERRRILHYAFERRYREQALDAFSIHMKDRPAFRVQAPRFQAVFCIDAREESFRRHIEEIAPDTETFAAPGFFCTPIYYRGVADAHYQTLCPIVVRPQHWLVEEVVYTLEEEHRRRAKTRRALGTASRSFHVGSRNITHGALLTAGVGVFASIPLVARVLFPRLTAAVRRRVGRFVQAPQVTRLRMERSTEKPGAEDGGIGFSLPEMANFAERVLRDIGLTTGMSRLVLFLGHGSFCLNNPHKACYDCGACSGSAGGPNARALANMCNDPRVREVLASRGLHIPTDTYFLGGQHNTCDDSVAFFDLDLLPRSHLRDLEAAKQILDEAGDRNAHERCRRFFSAPLDITFQGARRHVEGRSEDLAQTRPEFGNASNAMCFVGRRSRVRGLYMDRRSFMHSYDPTSDDEEATILGRILGPVVVVCSGINLQYFFSYIDSTGFGCGTKLPHNVTALQGVMDGHASDLRSGLPWQGVEIHEPMRLLFLFETRPEMMFKIMGRNALVARILMNGWAQLALLDPDSEKIVVFQQGKFVPYHPQSDELPKRSSSLEWYRGWREHLGFAQIEKTKTSPS